MPAVGGLELLGEGLLDPAGEPFAPSQASGQVLAVIDLDHHIGCAVECSIPARSEQTCFVVGGLRVSGFQFVHVETFAFNVPAMHYSNESAHRGPLAIR